MSSVDLIMEMEAFGRLTQKLSIPNEKRNDYQWVKENIDELCEHKELKNQILRVIEEIQIRLK